MFEIGDRVKTNETWKSFGRKPISGIVTDIREIDFDKGRYIQDNFSRHERFVPTGDIEKKTLLTIDGNVDHPMWDKLFEYDD